MSSNFDALQTHERARVSMRARQMRRKLNFSRSVAVSHIRARFRYLIRVDYARGSPALVTASRVYDIHICTLNSTRGSSKSLHARHTATKCAPCISEALTRATHDRRCSLFIVDCVSFLSLFFFPSPRKTCARGLELIRTTCLVRL